MIVGRGMEGRGRRVRAGGLDDEGWVEGTKALDGDNGRMVDEGLMEAGTDVEGAMDEGML